MSLRLKQLKDKEEEEEEDEEKVEEDATPPLERERAWLRNELLQKRLQRLH
jgi:hypothetical protein